MEEARRDKPPCKPKNQDRREREYLTLEEVTKLIDCAGQTGRHGARDAILIQMAFEHGLRTSEIAGLQWSDIDLDNGTLTLKRAQQSSCFTHELPAEEKIALLKLRNETPARYPFVFRSERKGQLKPRVIHAIIARAGVLAGIEFPIHPQMLRNSKGHQMAAGGADTKTINQYIGSLRKLDRKSPH
ncbi:MAG TPA: tyrosine-type recombinase/integrase [Planktothrix sp.]|jgi:type 1 fimbriae regulatory protein FimB/type 1 fimbriae regulatory protein FimE